MIRKCYRCNKILDIKKPLLNFSITKSLCDSCKKIVMEQIRKYKEKRFGDSVVTKKKGTNQEAGDNDL